MNSCAYQRAVQGQLTRVGKIQKTKRMLSPFLAVLVVLMLNGCTRVQEKLTPAAQPPSCIAPDARVSVPRGIDGLEIGMTPVQIGQLFTIREDQDPVAVLLAKYGKEKKGKALAREDKALQKGSSRFPRESANSQTASHLQTHG